MSFETDKAHLIQELADAQAQMRAQYGLADRSDLPADDASANAWAPGRRVSVTDRRR